MYRLIETYEDTQILTMFGRQFPAPSLVEDEDGIRIMVLPDGAETVRIHYWTAAAAHTVSAIMRPHATGYVWMLTERFMEEREEAFGGVFTLPHNGRWTFSPVPPTYRSMRGVAAEPRHEPREPSEDAFVQIHCHSEFSPLDGLSKVEEIVDAAVDDDAEGVGLTDHGVCAGHPDLMKYTTKAGIRPGFGIEAYVVDDRFRRAPTKPKLEEFSHLGTASLIKAAYDAAVEEWEPQAAAARDYYHLILMAQNNAGLRNLWAAATEANRDGFYYRPRMDWETLTRYSEGVMATTACLRGPLAHPLLLDQDIDRSVANLGRLTSIFGDRLYIELGTNALPEQKAINEALVALGHGRGVPLLAAVDSHYPCVGDKSTHRVWIATQTNKDAQDESGMFSGDTDHHLMTGKEVRAALSYLPEQVVDEAMTSTVSMIRRCDAKVEGKTVTPIFSKVGTDAERIQRDRERAVDICLANWGRKVIGKTKDESVYAERFERESRLLSMKGFWGYFLMVWKYVKAAKDAGILVGPGRGSGGGSLVAYLMDITEIDPVENDILFERFMTEGRTELPDFDVDFPASKRAWIEGYVSDTWGEDHVVRVGTHIRLKNKGVIRDLARVLKGTIDIDYRDINEITKIIEEAESDSAGLGMKWDDLWAQHGELLEPYREKYPLIFEHAERMVGRLKTYGKHAAGVVISPDDSLTDRLPLRLAGEGDKRQLVADFEMVALMEVLGLVKFDLLTLRNLDTLQMTMDLIEERHGIRINVYDWKDEYNDPLVWDELGMGHTLGVFQVETRTGTKYTKLIQPRSVAQLADVITILRPGPVRSGLTTTYINRRNGDEPVTYPDPRLEAALGKTLGCILYQEDIMQTCMVLALYNGEQADKVRKILGKKKVEDVKAEGEKFIPACVANGMRESAVIALWEQMGEFAKYSFNRAHAFAYAVLGHWTAWFKFHYPTEFMTACMSTVDKERIPEFIIEARRMGIAVNPPDVNQSGVGFTVADEGVVRYGLDSIKGIGDKACESLVSLQPYGDWQDFETKAATSRTINSGIVKLLARVGAFDSLVPNRRSLEAQLEWLTSDESGRCQFKDEDHLGANGLPCHFDWESEPVLLGKKGQALKPKPIPKKCTKACRHYTAPHLPDHEALRSYTDAEIREIEMELLGVHLSSTPFDRLPPDVLAKFAFGSDVEIGAMGDHKVVGIINKIRPYTASNGKPMGFVGLFARDVSLDITVFSDEWKDYHKDLWIGRLGFALISKNERGLTLKHYRGV